MVAWCLVVATMVATGWSYWELFSMVHASVGQKLVKCNILQVFFVVQWRKYSSLFYLNDA
jgi:hypothetical protein